MGNHKILILGMNGQVGSELQLALKAYNVVALDVPQINFTNTDTLDEALSSIKPRLIINAAAYTNVDKAEEECEIAHQINGRAVGFLAQEAFKRRIGFIHYSTDYVFDGTKGTPYVEEDEPNPINAYGRSKLLGEEAVKEVGGGSIILRTSWVYSLSRDSFVTKVLKWARSNENLRIVDDQISNPSWATMLAEITAELVHQGRKDWFDFFQKSHGLYHLAGKGVVSRYEWAKEILALDPNKTEQIVQSLETAKSDEFPTPAVRPQFSALVCSRFERTFSLKIPNWKSSLIRAMR